MCAVFDLRGDDGLLGGRRGGALLVVAGLREVERDEGDLVDGAVLVEVGVGGGAQQAGPDVAERPCGETDGGSSVSAATRSGATWGQPLIADMRETRSFCRNMGSEHGVALGLGVSSTTTQIQQMLKYKLLGLRRSHPGRSGRSKILNKK